jgi:DNA-binding XRE family transcriptional regulator
LRGEPHLQRHLYRAMRRDAHHGWTGEVSEPKLQPFGVLLRELRLAAGLSRDALAERAGLSAKTIAALEQGERLNPRVTTVHLLADALSVEPSVRADLPAAGGETRGAATRPSSARGWNRSGYTTCLRR